MSEKDEGSPAYRGGEETLEQLVAEGRVIPPTRDLSEVLSAPRIHAGSPPLSEILEDMRRDSR